MTVKRPDVFEDKLCDLVEKAGGGYIPSTDEVSSSGKPSIFRVEFDLQQIQRLMVNEDNKLLKKIFSKLAEKMKGELSKGKNSVVIFKVLPSVQTVHQHINQTEIVWGSLDQNVGVRNCVGTITNLEINGKDTPVPKDNGIALKMFEKMLEENKDNLQVTQVLNAMIDSAKESPITIFLLPMKMGLEEKFLGVIKKELEMNRDIRYIASKLIAEFTLAELIPAEELFPSPYTLRQTAEHTLHGLCPIEECSANKGVPKRLFFVLGDSSSGMNSFGFDLTDNSIKNEL